MNVTETCAIRQNEILREYLYDEPCPHNCENYKVPCHVEVPNVMIWSPHCVCKEGFYRLPNGTCVAVDDPECKELWIASEGLFIFLDIYKYLFVIKMHS